MDTEALTAAYGLLNVSCRCLDRIEQDSTFAKILNHADCFPDLISIGALNNQLSNHFQVTDAAFVAGAECSFLDDSTGKSDKFPEKIGHIFKDEEPHVILQHLKKVDFAKLYSEAIVPVIEVIQPLVTNMPVSVTSTPIVYNAGAVSAINNVQSGGGVKRLGAFRPPAALPTPTTTQLSEVSKENDSNDDDDDEYEPDPKVRARKQWRKQYDAAKKREAERKYNTPKFRDDDDGTKNTASISNETRQFCAPQPPPAAAARQQQPQPPQASAANDSRRPTFGARAPGFRPASKFVPPLQNRKPDGEAPSSEKQRPNVDGAIKENFIVTALNADAPQDERLKTLDTAMIDLILSEIVDHGAKVDWDDVAGLEIVKKNIMEVIVWPMLRPDLFRGIRGPPKGLLLFGPPGTGKTMIGKCIASQCNATFFSISASSLLSKWFGEAEKMVRTLFAVARTRQPAVIFIDEVDSMLCKRGQDDQECSRRIKTEFLVQLDGVTGDEDERILMIGATNLPNELDEAARRRFGKRLYVPLPSLNARVQIVHRLMGKMEIGACGLSEEDYVEVGRRAEGYSGSDMSHLCREAALGPLRSIRDIVSAKSTEIRPVILDDFISAFQSVRPSVAPKDLVELEAWNRQYGTINAE